MFVSRNYITRLKQLVEHFAVVVVVGARQVGKSTLLEHEYGKTYRTVVFDPVLDVGNARADPELFLQNNRPPLILDEIQYAPELVSVLKRRVDRDRRPGQYILTGSQQWGVLKTVSESLAGRAVFLDMDGFSVNETRNQPLGQNWLERWLSDPDGFPFQQMRCRSSERTMYEHLWRGCLPEAQFLPIEVIPDFLMAYRRTYIERDVRMLTEVSDVQLFGRFFQMAAALTAQEVNYAQLGRELGVTPQTAHRWLGILKATYQWHELPAFSGNAVKRVSAKPKGYLADTGLACSAQMLSSPAALGGHMLGGALFETAVVGELRKLAGLMSMPPQFYHWRTHAGAEVDVVLARDDKLYPIEIKQAGIPARRDTTGLHAFRETYPDRNIAQGLVLAPIDAGHKLTDCDIALPWDGWFESL